MNDRCDPTSAPDLVSWDVTGRCNLRCAHCYGGEADLSGRDDLDTAEALDFIDQMADAGVFQIVLLGGEPLLRPDLFTLIERARGYGLGVGMSTNGTLVNEEISGRLAELGMDGIQVSIDSDRAEEHDRFRGVTGSWSSAWQAVRTLVRAGCRVIVATVITTFNVDDLSSVAEQALQAGATEFRTLRLIPVGRGREVTNLMIGPDRVQAAAEELAALSERLRGSLDVRMDESFPFLPNSQIVGEFCTAGTSTCSVKSNGDLVPCSYFDQPELIAGNVRHERFHDLWLFRSVLREFRRVPLSEGECSQCPHVKRCRGGCRAAAYNAVGCHAAPDPYCFMVKSNGRCSL